MRPICSADTRSISLSAAGYSMSAPRRRLPDRRIGISNALFKAARGTRPRIDREVGLGNAPAPSYSALCSAVGCVAPQVHVTLAGSVHINHIFGSPGWINGVMDQGPNRWGKAY